MTDNISSVSFFINRFKSGFAKPNRFIARFRLPAGIPSSVNFGNNKAKSNNIFRLNNNLNGDQSIDISCRAATMPSRTLMAYQHVQLTAPFQVPFSQQYEPITLEFIDDINLRVRNFFETWQSSIVNIVNNTMNFMQEYATDVHIIQLDNMGNPTYGVTLFQAWPIVIGDIQYDYSMRDQLITIPISLSYLLWKSTHDESDVSYFGINNMY